MKVIELNRLVYFKDYRTSYNYDNCGYDIKSNITLSTNLNEELKLNVDSVFIKDLYNLNHYPGKMKITFEFENQEIYQLKQELSDLKNKAEILQKKIDILAKTS